MRVHIVGASGSGTTTLGRALAARLACPHRLLAADRSAVPAGPPAPAATRGWTSERSRRLHEAWLAALPCPVLRLEGTASVDEQLDRIGYHPGREATGRSLMKLCQFFVPGKGKRVGVVAGDTVLDITAPRAGVASVTELIAACGTAARLELRVRGLARTARTRVPWAALDRAPSPRHPHLLAPLDPPEVWGAGITYRRSREYYEAHTGEGGRTKGIYDFVYDSERPELFFKATAARTAGPNARIGVRADSTLTAVEAELAVVVGRAGAIVGYTIGNDLSAWDIERANPLFLPQSKVFDGCFACGPVLVTAGEMGDPQALELSCTIHRGGRAIFQGRVNTKEMRRPCAELVGWLCRGNTCPAGSVLSTGTGILVPDEHALADGDVVEITLERVGTLRNPVRRLRA